MEVKQHLKKLRSCVKFEVAILGSSSLIIRMVSDDAKQHLKKLSGRALDSLLKGRGFESRQERRENFLLQCQLSVLILGSGDSSVAGIAQWLDRRTHDRKVAGSNPCWSGGRIFFSRVNFLC